MSIRIHKLAEELGLDNKAMMVLLKERKIISPDVRSVSSTVDNISAEALREEFAAKATPEPAAVEEVPAESAETVAEDATPRVMIPSGVFVKSVQDLEREKEAAAALKAAAAAAAQPPPPPPPAPVAKAPHTPPPVAPPRFVSAPPPVPRIPPAPVSPPSVVIPSPPVTPVSRPPMPPVLSAPPAPPPTPVPAPVAPRIAVVAPPVSAPPAPPPMAKAPPLVPPMPPRHSGPPPISMPRPPAVPGAVPAVPSLAAEGAAPTPVEPGELKILHLKPPIVVRDFATALGLKPFKLISELNQLVGFAAMNSNIEESVAQKVAEKYGFILEIKHRGDVAAQQAAAKEKKEKKPEEDESKFLVSRPPVVCILGHVDHGKTSLLDAIRKANVVAGEAGGITQHIGAYQIEFGGRKITFLDTPGHAAFTKMRARGASVTDIAILVVAADDGFMPQTEEALKIVLAEKENHPERFALIVAINKVDVKGANIDQVKNQMQQHGIPPEDWGGDTITVPVAAIKHQGITELLEMIALQADVLELKANPKAVASGVVIESEIDFGRGPLATVIVQRGTLRVGDALVSGSNYAKVRALFDDQGKNIKEAPPAMPVRVIGWSGTPDSGATFRVVKNAREAEKLAEEENQRVRKEAVTAAAVPKEVSVEKLFANIAATQAKVLKIIIKTDVFGSSEAVRNILEGIKSTKVQLELVAVEVGLVTKNDVLMAGAAGSVIIGFNTRLEPGVTPLAKHHGVRIAMFDIIYELGDKVREMMADLLDPDIKEIKTGAAEVRQVFPLAKGFVAGCLVTEGKINRNASARLRRGKEIVYEGKIETLKRFKDDANEIRAGLECGMKLDNYNGYAAGDVIECYEIQKVRASL